MSEKPVILLVENDPMQLANALRHLHKKDLYSVVTASEASLAFQVAVARQPALIISDYYMPGEDGMALCRMVKSDPTLRNTMFMLLTAESDIDRKVEALDRGADDYLSKPYNESEFLSRVQVLLRIRSLQDELQQERDDLRKVNRTLQDNFSGIVNLLTKLIALRVPNASGGERAPLLCKWMGERLGLEEREIHSIELAARLHEIGKVSLSDDVIQRYPQGLTDAARKRFQEFPLFGEVLVQGIPQLEVIAPLLRHQLENFDGTGYPDRLMGDEIPLGSRILRAVNLVEQMSDGEEHDVERLNDILQRARGTILDPRVLQLLREYLRAEHEPSWLEGKQQISVFDLKEGMIIACDICTGTGTKLLPKDSKLSPLHIERLLAQHHFDPIINSIYIFKT
jgi:response regulator RpfG family c-di-GMP phosphodiesterase